MKTEFWNSAAYNGLLLALVSIIFTLTKALIPTTGIAAALTITKLVFTVGVLYYFIKQYSREQENFLYKNGFRYGFAVSLCSAVVLAVYAAVHYLYIFPDALDKEIETVLEVMEKANAPGNPFLDMMLKHYLPVKVFGEFLNPVIWGLIVSAILASFTKKEVPLFDPSGE
ncbi:MAG: DUF4199 domain-containing protein [Prevotellaceae bacterium]|jgi:hypothetical protein|nr:DUF4199 domain-containing protein [Prevotellaceae bacterium]